MAEFNNRLVSFNKASREIGFSHQGITDLITHCNAIRDSYGVTVQYIPDENFNLESFITEWRVLSFSNRFPQCTRFI